MALDYMMLKKIHEQAVITNELLRQLLEQKQNAEVVNHDATNQTASDTGNQPSKRGRGVHKRVN